jgi:hypothetical protein
MFATGTIFKAAVTIDMPRVQLAQNVFYFHVSNPASEMISAAEVVTAIADWCDDFYTWLQPLVATDVTVDFVDVDNIAWVVDKWETIGNLGTGVISNTGESISDMLPHACAPVITAKTMAPKSRGRKFIAGVTENNVDDSIPTGDLLTDLLGAAVVWLTDISLGTSFDLEPCITCIDGVMRLLVSTVISTVVGSMRRRKPGVGA